MRRMWTASSLTEEEIIANLIVTMVGGQETTTNLIGNGMLTLFRNPDAMAQLARRSFDHRARQSKSCCATKAPASTRRGSRPTISSSAESRSSKRQAVIAVMGAANRDPERFPDPDRLDIERKDNRHVAFGWAAHFCFGAHLARIEGQIAVSTLLQRLPDLELDTNVPPVWRHNLGLRGLTALPVRFGTNHRSPSADQTPES